MFENLSFVGVVAAGVYLICLGAVALSLPDRASHFLLKFAASIQAHYLELLLRLIIGFAFLLHAPNMGFQHLFWYVGWVLILSTIALFGIPWRWHQRFARFVVPYAVRHITPIGISSALMGLFVVACAV